MKSKLSEIGWAVCDLIDAYNAVVVYNKIHEGAIKKPVAYALYQTWKKHDEGKRDDNVPDRRNRRRYHRTHRNDVRS